MKKLDPYQCDFCSSTGTKEDIQKHEKRCDSDPSKMKCGSCKHFESYFEFGLYYTEECHAGVSGHQMNAVQKGEEICTRWYIS